MKMTVSLLITLSLLGLSVSCTSYHTGGAGTGAEAGGAAGAVLDSRNLWRGGVIGGEYAAMPGATFADVSRKASYEAAMANKPVAYRTENGRGLYQADPLGYDERARCRKVHERVWEDDRLVRERVKEVCEGQRYEQRN